MAQLSTFQGKASMGPSTVPSALSQGIQHPRLGVETRTTEPAVVPPPPGIHTDLGTHEEVAMDTGDSSPGAVSQGGIKLSRGRASL